MVSSMLVSASSVLSVLVVPNVSVSTFSTDSWFSKVSVKTLALR